MADVTVKVQATVGPPGAKGDVGPQGDPGEVSQAALDALRTGADQLTVPDGRRAVPALASLEPMPLVDVRASDADATNPVPVDVFGGHTWGAFGGTIYRSADDGAAWEAVASGPAGANPTRLIPTADGEMMALLTAGLYRSTGWTGEPGSAPAWTLVADPADSGPTARFLRWGFDGDGIKFILVEYSAGNRSDSRLVKISIDMGQTFAVAWDTEVEFPDHHQDTHLHGACFDPWEDRFWFCEGHTEEAAGAYFSDDDGATWTRMGGALQTTATPTVMVATDHGIVCGTDSNPDGIWVIRRRADPADMEWQIAWRWTTAEASAPVGFAMRGFRDPDTGIVYVGFRTNLNSAPPVIAASDGRVAGLVYEYHEASVSSDRVSNVVVTPGGKLLARVTRDTAGSRNLRADTQAPGTQPAHLYDTGGVLGADGYPGSPAIGPGATTTNHSAVAVGRDSMSTGVSVAIGRDTEAGARSVAIGKGAAVATEGVAIGVDVAGSSYGVVIGYRAARTTGAISVVAIGQDAVAATDAIAIGRGASAAGSGRMAIGRSANAGLGGTSIGHQTESNNSGTAVGREAKATHDYSVAVGRDTVTTAGKQVQIEDRHIEATELADDPAAPAAGAARLYFREDKMFVRTSTGIKEVAFVTP